MEASEVKRIKELEEENARLKRMYANLAMDNEILRDLFTKRFAAKRQLSEELVKNRKIPVSRMQNSFINTFSILLYICKG